MQRRVTLRKSIFLSNLLDFGILVRLACVLKKDFSNSVKKKNPSEAYLFNYATWPNVCGHLATTVMCCFRIPLHVYSSNVYRYDHNHSSGKAFQ